MYNGKRKVVEIAADTEGFEEIFKLLLSVLKHSLPHYYPGEIHYIKEHMGDKSPTTGKNMMRAPVTSNWWKLYKNMKRYMCNRLRHHSTLT